MTDSTEDPKKECDYILHTKHVHVQHVVMRCLLKELLASKPPAEIDELRQRVIDSMEQVMPDADKALVEFELGGLGLLE